MAKHHLTCLLLIIFHFSGASGYLIGRGIADITGLVAEGLLVRNFLRENSILRELIFTWNCPTKLSNSLDWVLLTPVICCRSLTRYNESKITITVYRTHSFIFCWMLPVWIRWSRTWSQRVTPEAIQQGLHCGWWRWHRQSQDGLRRHWNYDDDTCSETRGLYCLAKL